jgi:ADP-heptose:LPS heptosyltransferase
MRRLTEKIGKGKRSKKEVLLNSEIRHVLICRPNHRLGNLLLVTPLLQEVMLVLPDAKIDLFVKGSAAHSLFMHYNVNHIIQLPRRPFENLWAYFQGWLELRRRRYDLVLNAVWHSSSGRLSVQFSNGHFKFFGDIDQEIVAAYADHEHMGKYPVYSFRNRMARLGFPNRNGNVHPLLLKLTSAELLEGKRTLNKLVLADRKTICVFTYATGEKMYPSSWWEPFYEKLKSDYCDYNIIEILPAENLSQIHFKAPCFHSLDIRKVGAVIANTSLFIGADSGMMHLASAVKTPTVGLFKKTDPKIYEPFNTHSVGIDTNLVDIDQCRKTIDRIIRV